MNYFDYIEQYDSLVPFMDEDSRKYLARCIQNGETPEFKPLSLALWVQLADNHQRQKRAFWENIMGQCKTKRAKK